MYHINGAMFTYRDKESFKKWVVFFSKQSTACVRILYFRNTRFFSANRSQFSLPSASTAESWFRAIITIS